MCRGSSTPRPAVATTGWPPWGTVNLDYRSLYLHFECSALLYGGKVLEDIRADFAAIEAECEPVGLEDCRTGFLGTLHSAILRCWRPSADNFNRPYNGTALRQSRFLY